MNLLVRGVRFSMRVGRAQCVKNVFEPKADSTDTDDFFYMGDADPDRVRAPFCFCFPFLAFPTCVADALNLPYVDHGRGYQGIHPQALLHGVPPSECGFSPHLECE